jgi:hypothetical protein
MLVEIAVGTALSDEQTLYLKTLKELLTKQEADVVCVRILPNFGKDNDVSLIQGRLVLKGLQIQFREDYKLTEDDVLWMQQSFYKQRACYAIDDAEFPEKLELDGLHESVGAYEMSETDEFGVKSTCKRLVIDTGVAEGAWKDMLQSGKTVQEVYEVLKHSKVKQSVANRQAEISAFFRGKLLFTGHYNVFNSNGETFGFYNDCYAAAAKGDRFLVSAGALHGYVELKANKVFENVFKAVVPASFGETNVFYNWPDFSERHRERFLAFPWGNEPCSTTLLRKHVKLSNYQHETIAAAVNCTLVGRLALNALALSRSRTAGLLDVESLLALTPSKADLVDSLTSSNNAFLSMYAADEVATPFNLENELVLKLLKAHESIRAKHGVSLLNPELLKGGNLILSREIIKSVI